MSETQPLMQDKPPLYQPGVPPPPQQQQPYYPPPQGGYPPPQGGYQAAPVPPPTSTTNTNVTVVQTAPITSGYGQGPCSVTCPTCHNQVSSVVMYEAGGFAWLMVFILFLVGFILPIFWFGLCLIPLCIDGCKDIVHVCPVCRTRLGQKSRM